jgi:hypothetical protein
MENNSNRNGGIGFFGLLGIVFIVLKLTGVIKWAWVWVLAPIWGSIALALILILVLVIIKALTE